MWPASPGYEITHADLFDTRLEIVPHHHQTTGVTIASTTRAVLHACK